ncbi:hypothetical protein Acsp05_63200 [Actinokineospora sp. NBRC 105648]|nr:hypothetical protein Acsp05_63200 [Actinokineospora sp. NBRC 105648]
MGRVGAAGDNAAMESFFALLQNNVLDRRTWSTRDELRIAIVTWIEGTYHRRRRQTALGRLTPVEYEAIMTTPASQSGCVTTTVTYSCSRPASGISYVNTLDFLASSERARVASSPDDVPGKSGTTWFDGWAVPPCGVAFVWVVDNEQGHSSGSEHDR